MKFWKKDKKISSLSNNRLNLIIAIVFLLAVSILIRLFNLQVLKNDFYLFLAASQHQITNLLEPERGKIFMQDFTKGGSELYPLATNKNFAVIYAIPKEVKDEKNLAEQLYFSFWQEKTERKVEKLLKEQEAERLSQEIAQIKDWPEADKKNKEAEIIQRHEILMADQYYQELRKIKKEAEINLRKKQILDNYLKILTKANDPYEPLAEKVEEGILKKLYFALSAKDNPTIGLEDILIKNNLMVIKNSDQEKELKIAGLGFFFKEFRYYPESNSGANLVGFVGYAGEQTAGRYGLEEFFDHELAGNFGLYKAEKDARGEAIILNQSEYQKPQNGADLILTINRTIEYQACKQLNQAVAKHGADGGTVIIMEPKTGAILAMCSSPDYDPNNYQTVKELNIFNNPAIFAQYEPGSIFKVITMAAGLDQEKITPQTTYQDNGPVKIANYSIENSDRQSHGQVTMAQVLEQSLNTGAIFVSKQIGPEVFASYLKNFGFGEKTGIELEGEAKGDISNLTDKKKNKELYAATASFGQGVAVTPLQMITAFAAIANGGLLVKPFVVKEIIKNDGSKIETQPKMIRRVFSEKAATLLTGMMVNVVENGHGKRAGVKGYYIAGKTGTAQVPKKDGRGYQPNAHIGSFAGFAPVDEPRFVMLVRIDQPRDVEWAESSAAPLFGQLAEFVLNYLQVPKER